jgi:hypothetical protein
MHENQNKLIGYLLIAIVAYYVLSAIMPLMFWALVVCVIWRLYVDHNKGR